MTNTPCTLFPHPANKRRWKTHGRLSPITGWGHQPGQHSILIVCYIFCLYHSFPWPIYSPSPPLEPAVSCLLGGWVPVMKKHCVFSVSCSEYAIAGGVQLGCETPRHGPGPAVYTQDLASTPFSQGQPQ